MKHTLMAVLVASTFSVAADAGLPNGKPFQEIASELSALDAEIAAIEERIAGNDAGVQEAISVLAEAIAANADNIEQLTTDLAASIEVSEAALRSLAEELAAEVEARIAADAALAARIETLEAIDHAKVTGQCPDGGFVFELTETSIGCRTIEQAEDASFYRVNEFLRNTGVVPTIVLLPKCNNLADFIIPAGFFATPATATVPEMFVVYDPGELPRVQARAINASSLAAYAICKSAP